MTSPKIIRTAFLGLYAISGFTVLAMETIWMRILALYLGDTVYSATLVLVVFFAFAALGNAISARLVGRWQRPLRVYALLEGGFGLSALLCFMLGVGWLAQPGGALAAGPTWIFHLLVTFALVGLPSFLAGATLPVLLRAWVHTTQQRVTTGALFYAAQLGGAALGVLGAQAGAWLLGYQQTVLILASIQGLLALTAWLLASRQTAPLAESTPTRPTRATEPINLTPRPWLPWTLCLWSGLATLGLQVLSMRYCLLLQIGSVYTIGSVLLAYLVGLSLGAFLASKLRRHFSLEPLLAVSLLVGGLLTASYPLLLQGLLEAGVFSVESASPTHLTLVTAFRTTALFLPLLLPTGMIFPLSWELLNRQSEAHGRWIGLAAAANKMAAAVGAGLLPWVILPLVGLPHSFGLIGLGYLILAALATPARYQRVRPRIALATVLPLALVAWFYRPPVVLNENETLRALYVGPGSVTSVIDDLDQGSRRIVLNQSYTLNGTASALIEQRQQGWLPLLLHPDPQEVVYIGMASGISANAVLDLPSVRRLQVAELVPEVARAAKEHFEPWSGRLFQDPRATIHQEDGRRLLARQNQPVDLIIVDLFHPANATTANLYSVDFFASARERLAPDGLFCLWLPTYQLDAPRLAMVARSFAKAFPHAIAIRGNFNPLQPFVGLVGSPSPIAISSDELAPRLENPAWSVPARSSFFLKSPEHAALMLLGDLHGDSFAWPPGHTSTDDQPRFRFLAPLTLEAGTAIRGNTLLNLLGHGGQTETWPSLTPGEAEQRQRFISASNHLYAAAVQSIPLPEATPEQQRQRQARQHFHLTTANRLVPLLGVP